MKELYERIPFRKRLTELPTSYGASVLFETSCKNYVVRIEDNDGHEPWRIDNLKRGRTLVERFNTEYGIAVPRFDIILAPSPTSNLTAVYYVVEKVSGKNLPDARINPQDAFDFYSSLIKYHEDVFETKDYFLNDIDLGQFMYGKTKNDDQDRIYLVDIDPFYSVFDGREAGFRDFSDNLERLVVSLNASEKICGRRFPALIQRLKLLLEQVWGTAEAKQQGFVKTLIENVITEETASDLSENRFGRFQNEHEDR